MHKERQSRGPPLSVRVAAHGIPTSPDPRAAKAALARPGVSLTPFSVRAFTKSRHSSRSHRAGWHPASPGRSPPLCAPGTGVSVMGTRDSDSDQVSWVMARSLLHPGRGCSYEQAAIFWGCSTPRVPRSVALSGGRRGRTWALCLSL